MPILYKQIKLSSDMVLCHFKRDIPCFQFTGFQPADMAGVKELKQLLKAVVNLADWADETSKPLSDHYPAKHGLEPAQALKRNGAIRLPLDRRNPSVYISIYHDYVEVPAVWYNSGKTQESWGKFEAAIREAIRLIS